MGSRAARFTLKEVETALLGGANVGVPVAVLIQTDGSLAIVPADKLSVTVTASDIDARIAKFGGK